jgi:hypothetical protein
VTWETVCSQLRRMAENKKEKLDRKKSVWVDLKNTSCIVIFFLLCVC